MKKIVLSLALVATVAFVSCKDTAKETPAEEVVTEEVAPVAEEVAPVAEEVVTEEVAVEGTEAAPATDAAPATEATPAN